MVKKILVVDDEVDMQDLILMIFREQINSNELSFIFALNGLEALNLLKENYDISMIMTDINMPVMNGLDLLKKIKECSLVCKCVVVSAYGDMANIRTAMNYGASDFITKPIDFEDYKKTIYKVVKEGELLKAALEAEYSLKEINIELEVARSIQESMLPSNFKEFTDYNIDVAGKMIPAKSVGGDFFDIFPITENKVGIFIADVSGKNISACIYMAVAKSILKLLCLNGLDCGEVFRILDGILSKDNNSCMFVTAFYATLDVTSGLLTFCNAGHNPPYIIKNNKTLTRVESNHGPILGMKNIFGALSEYKESSLVLNEGECLFLYTDGVTEALNPRNELFSEKRLENALLLCNEKSAKELLEHVMQTIHNFSENTIQSDDITMMAVKNTGWCNSKEKTKNN